jgi:hypothetical protein
LIDGGLRGIFRKHLKEVDWTSIETGMTGRGVPDSNGCYHGSEFWIEYKKTTGLKIKLRPEQIVWIDKRVRHGGRVFVAVRRQKKKTDELWIFDGGDVVGLARNGLRCSALGIWDGGPKHWEWTKVLRIICL